MDVPVVLAKKSFQGFDVVAGAVEDDVLVETVQGKEGLVVSLAPWLDVSAGVDDVEVAGRISKNGARRRWWKDREAAGSLAEGGGEFSPEETAQPGPRHDGFFFFFCLPALFEVDGVGSVGKILLCN